MCRLQSEQNQQGASKKVPSARRLLFKMCVSDSSNDYWRTCKKKQGGETLDIVVERGGGAWAEQVMTQCISQLFASTKKQLPAHHYWSE